MTATDPSTHPRVRRVRPGPGALPRVIDRLDRLAADKDTLSMEDVVREIGVHGHAPLLMVVAVLMILPLGMIPGVGGALGLLAALIGVHMLIRREQVALPGFIARKTLPSQKLRWLLTKTKPTSVWLSRVLKIRFELLAASPPAVILIGMAMIASGLSLLVLGAIPVATPLLGLPVAMFAVGLLARDGLAIIGGWVTLGLAILSLARIWHSVVA